jgi:hypothetical protein
LPEGDFLLYGTQKPGLFNLRYKVTDNSGNVGYSSYRGILVVEANTGACVTGLSDDGNAGKLINVYPNPTSGKLTVSLNVPSTEPVDITVTNRLGQQVAKAGNGLLNNGTYSIDLSNQAAGVYVVTVQTTTKSATKKVILSR